jgi:hypothetical protein
MGAPLHHVTTQLRDDYGLSELQARHAVNSLLKEITASNQAEIAELRELSVTRIMRDLLTMRGSARPPWAAIARHESLIADLQGTKQHKLEIVPTRTKGELYRAVLETMSEERLSRIAAEQVERERALGLKPGALTIEAHGEPA